VMQDITREEFHETVQEWLKRYHSLVDARKCNDGSEIVFPYAPGKVNGAFIIYVTYI
jgi:hypothetical protein